MVRFRKFAPRQKRKRQAIAETVTQGSLGKPRTRSILALEDQDARSPRWGFLPGQSGSRWPQERRENGRGWRI